MIISLSATLAGLFLLVWGADRFVEGAASTARHFTMPPLLIGMVIVGFGTSAPEMMVSTIAAWHGNPSIALGNAYGSNIANISLILGLTALVSPIKVHSRVLRKELPILTLITMVALLLMSDLHLSRVDGFLHLAVFAGLMGWSIREGLRQRGDALGRETEYELKQHILPLDRSLFWLAAGLLVMIFSSRLLVWGAVEIARQLGVSDLLIGLTVLAAGTSLPELASSISAVRKNEHDIALGNVIGSNLFNTLAVVGIAGTIHPVDFDRTVYLRDMLTMGVITLALFIFSYNYRRSGNISRFKGALLLACYIGYISYLIATVFIHQ